MERVSVGTDLANFVKGTAPYIYIGMIVATYCYCAIEGIQPADWFLVATSTTGGGTIGAVIRGKASK